MPKSLSEDPRWRIVFLHHDGVFKQKDKKPLTY